MGFNTLPFVFVFLPLFLAAFYLVPARWRAGLLCLGSLVFYVIGVWQRPWCLAPMLGLAVLVYLLGLRMRPRESRGLLVLGLAAMPLCALIAVVLLQSGKSAGIAGAIGGGMDTFSSSNMRDSWVWE